MHVQELSSASQVITSDLQPLSPEVPLKLTNIYVMVNYFKMTILLLFLKKPSKQLRDCREMIYSLRFVELEETVFQK